MTNRPRRGPPNPDERRPTSPDPMDPPDKGPPGPLSFLLGQPEMLPLILTTVIITGGALCYWLARYLTNPLQKLRNAAKELAQGDLSVRVGSSVGKRRDEIGDLGRDFDHMAGRMDSLVNAQRRLLRDISHELRSPLARVNVALGIARQHADPDRSAPLDRIEHETERLNDLIGQLLALARFESGTDGVHQDMVDLVQIIQNVTEDADFEAQSRHRQVRLIRSEPCATQGSSEMLHRAIENVIRNAVYYTAEHTTVEVALRRQNDRNEASAVITVRDHGQGVPQESLADIFRPFYRVAEARERQSGGMGLGLSITERAIRAHGGHIQASNAPGGGLLIEIQLPLIQT